MEKEPLQNPEPKKPRKRPTPKDMPNRIEPLDELGYFKKGKDHDRILDAATCHCDRCLMIGMQRIYDKGVRIVSEMVEVWSRYEDLSAKVHRDRMNNLNNPPEEFLIVSDEKLKEIRLTYKKKRKQE